MEYIKMRTLSKKEMKAVSGGQQQCGYNQYFSTTTYSCTYYPAPPEPKQCALRWVSTGYNQGYWTTNCL